MNVISTASIDGFVKSACSFATRDTVRTWVGRVLPKYIKRSADLLVRVRREPEIELELGKKAKKAIVEKLVEAFRRGEVLYKFAPDSDLRGELLEEVRSVIDWLDSVPEWDRHLKRVDRLSYRDAVQMSASWHAKLLSLAADADDPDVVEEIRVVEQFADGSRFIELLGPVALLREGNLMGHCVGGRGYVDAVQKGLTHIYSLRDPLNAPHVTIEVRRRSAVQIKGKGNTAPVERWAEQVRPIVKSSGWTVGYDGNRIGLVTISGRTCDHPDEVVDAVVESKPPAAQSFSAALPPAALALLLKRKADAGIEAKARLFTFIAASCSVETHDEGPVVEGPDELTIRRYRHTFPSMFLDALSSGLFTGLEDVIADRVGRHLDTVLDFVSTRPQDVHAVEFSATSADRRSALDQLAAFSGRLPALHALRLQVEDARRGHYSRIAAAIRRETSPAVRRKSETSRSWAAELSHLQRVSKDGLEQSRALFPQGALI